jgi:alpha-tubulin suppressor-like RCC1 family protein
MVEILFLGHCARRVRGGHPAEFTADAPAGREPIRREVHLGAMTSDGAAYCWGRNASGQLGDGSADDSEEPVRVEGLSGVVSISAGQWHSCAVTGDGTAWCWGAGSSGELGNGFHAE